MTIPWGANKRLLAPPSESVCDWLTDSLVSARDAWASKRDLKCGGVKPRNIFVSSLFGKFWIISIYHRDAFSLVHLTFCMHFWMGGDARWIYLHFQKPICQQGSHSSEKTFHQSISQIRKNISLNPQTNMFEIHKQICLKSTNKYVWKSTDIYLQGSIKCAFMRSMIGALVWSRIKRLTCSELKKLSIYKKMSLFVTVESA